LLYLITLSVSQSVSFDVSFQSQAPSGTLNILGTLSIPTSTNLVPAVILLSGSGPSTRNETVGFGFPGFLVSPPQSPPCNSVPTSLSIFTQLSAALVAKGIAVLRYDKRDCLQPNVGCSYLRCTDPGQMNCVNLTIADPTDLVIDTVSAVNFLRTNFRNLIDPNGISLIGHSQGCTVAPYVANMVPIKKIVQLMGTAMSLDVLLVKQFYASIALFQTGYDICHATKENPFYESLFQQLVNETEMQLVLANYWLPLIRNGSVSDYTPTLFGSTAKYWRTLMKWGNFTEVYNTMKSAATTTPILAINSPTDFQIFPEAYRALHSILLSLPNAKISIIQNLCHFLIDNSLTSNQISTEIIEKVANFILPPPLIDIYQQ